MLLYLGIQLYIHVQGCIVVIDEGININIQCLAYFGPYFVKFCMTHAIYVHVCTILYLIIHVYLFRILMFRYLFHEIMLVLYIVYLILFFVPSPLSLFDEIMLHLSPYDVCALVFLQMENLCIRN